MRTNNIPVDNTDKPPFLEKVYSPPERSFATPWFLTNRGFFRVRLTIVGPVTQQPKDNLSLSRSQSESRLEEISDEVKSLEKQAL